MKEDDSFKFEFSLEILNHLGRGLYRSFATVVAEAISNSWDAEATKAEIVIDKNGLSVTDNGKGMDKTDFKSKFLTVGYSRRLDPTNRSKRKVIGRKGIGKLAMLSISEKVIILTKKKGGKIVAGRINNSILDKKIAKESKYSLENLSESEKKKLFPKQISGTKIIFENIKTNLNSEDIIRKYLATQFNFIFSLNKNDKFQMLVNGKPISKKDLEELDLNTQFIWFLGKADPKRGKARYKNLDRLKVIKETSFKFKKKVFKIKGFIASVKKPQNLLLRGSGGDFKTGINLFCNGRLRQENLIEEISSKKLVEEYLYGEVHMDGFEDEQIDRFTSSREGIIKDDPLYQIFLKELKKIQSIITVDWTPWRGEFKDEGDIDDGPLPKHLKRLQDSKNWREKDFEEKIDSTISDKDVKKTLKEKLKELSYKNTSIYQDLFILENIFREYIKIKKLKETDLDKLNEEEKEILDAIKDTRGKRIKEQETHALKGKITREEHYLNYADLWYLASIIDVLTKKAEKKPSKRKYRKELCLDASEIIPIRNPVMHTNEITDDVINWEKIKNVIDYIERLKDR